MDRLRSILLIVLLLAMGATVLFGIVRDPAIIIGGVVAVLVAVIAIPEIWDRFRPLDGKRSRKGEPNEADYLHGRLEVFQREEELFVRLAGETPIQSRFDSFAAETFNSHIPGEKVKTYDDIAGAVDDYRQFILVGDPGAGKSTTLRHIAAEAMERRLDSTVHPLPLWINLGSSDNPPDARELIDYWWAYYGIPGDLQTMLNNNRVWLFLDGLNEMPEQKASREERAQSIRTLLHTYPDVRVVVTCREQDYDDKMALDLPVVQIKALNREQIQAFIALRLGVESDLLAKIDAADHLQRMASNPYQLVLLIDIYRDTKQLPADLNDLYRLYFEVRFASDAGRRLLKLSQGQLRRQLEQLAFRMIAVGKGTAADARWTQRQIGRKALRDGLSLQLLVQDKDKIRFYHQSLHSYFAFPMLKEALQTHWLDRWRKKRRVRFIEGIGNLREAAAPAVPVLIETLRDEDVFVRRTAAVALGRIGGASAVPALIEALRDADWYVRMAANETLGNIGMPAVFALIKALRNPDRAVWWEAATILENIGTPAVPALSDALSDPDERVRRVAAETLGNIGANAAPSVPVLIEMLNDPDERVRRVAAETLGNIGANAAPAVPALIEALRDPDEGMRWIAAETLGNIGADAASAVPVLSEMLRGADEGMRRVAAETLGNIGANAAPAVPALIEMLSNSDERVRRVAAETLGNIGANAAPAVPALIEMLSETNKAAQRSAVKALPQIGADTAQGRHALSEILYDADRDMQKIAAEALVCIGVPAVPTLIDLLVKQDKLSPEVILKIFRDMGMYAAAAAAILITFMYDKDTNLREQVIKTLGYTGKENTEVIDLLINCLNDANHIIRLASVRALGDIGAFASAAVPGLTKTLHDTDYSVRVASETALKKIGTPEARTALEAWQQSQHKGGDDNRE